MTMVKMAMKIVSFVSGTYSVVIMDVTLLKYFCFLFNLHAWIIIPILVISELLLFFFMGVTHTGAEALCILWPKSHSARDA